MEKVFVVTEIGFEYNDEVYRRTDEGCGSPVVGYRSREKAQAEATRRNIVAFRKADLDYYGYDIDELFDRNTRTRDMHRVTDILHEHFVEGDESLENFAFAMQKASDAELAEVIKIIRLKFFDIVEIGLE